MARSHIRSIALAAVVASSAAGAAHGGGLEANGYNWDLLFDPATYVGRGTVTPVIINHDISNPVRAPGAGTVASSSNRLYYNFGVKADLLDTASCLVSVQNPFGSGTDRDFLYAAGTDQAVRERISSTDLGLTCDYGFNLGPGTVSVIGGISGQHLDYDADLAIGPGVTGPVSIDGLGMGWRAGAAYEIPEMALRVSAIYNAGIDYELDGSADLGLGFPLPAEADVSTPQSFEVKAQTGIAPGWLVLGSVKWVDWSVLDTLAVVTPVATLPTTLNYEDGWTVTAGVGHQLTEQVSLLGSLTWDKGTSRENADGVLENGTQTDRWGISVGGAYRPSDTFELTGGLSYSLTGSGDNELGESWDTGSVLAFSVGAKASF